LSARQETSTMSTSLSVPQQLMEEADRLAGVLDDAQEQVGSRVLEAFNLVEGQKAASKNARTRAIYAGVQKNHKKVGARGSSIADGAQKLLQDYREDNYLARTQQIMAQLGGVNARKLADEELLARAKQAWQTIEGTPDAVALHIASVQISLFSQTFYYADVLNAFLDYPSVFRRTLDVAGELVKALATDVAGAAIPFLGTLNTIFELMEPRIERLTEQMRQATKLLDRLFQFDDQLTELLGYASFVEENTRLADRSLGVVRVSFKRDAAWLRAAL
jgi:hypothetical protein